MSNRSFRALGSKAVHGLLQSDAVQVKDARDENDLTNYKNTTASLVAYERDDNKVLGKKNGELEGRLAAAAGTIWELEKNQAALKSQLAIKVSTDLFVLEVMQISLLLSGSAEIGQGDWVILASKKKQASKKAKASFWC